MLPDCGAEVVDCLTGVDGVGAETGETSVGGSVGSGGDFVGGCVVGALVVGGCIKCGLEQVGGYDVVVAVVGGRDVGGPVVVWWSHCWRLRCLTIGSCVTGGLDIGGCIVELRQTLRPPGYTEWMVS